ncbi:hypothetical protein AVEN_26452-1 [Araneus ventricosus]|uniref:RNase H type-1 domain-containing protein n=1 Tax=Araneus ventricosus TaxID=182803 RepID=A0A4Y2FZA1_ARAVE|nr:hypothetical protein AVEN_26452-1 [Araneus ventricosus]
MAGLKVVSSFSTTSPIAQQIQTILLSHPSIKLGWIKAHVSHKGNEAADSLAKQAASVESYQQYPAPKNLKGIIKNSSLRRWQEEWVRGLTGRNIHRIHPCPSFIEQTRHCFRYWPWPVPLIFQTLLQ